MKFTRSEPCAECPFLKKYKHGYTEERLNEFASSAFPCHKTAELIGDEEGMEEYRIGSKSVACAGALIYAEKRGVSTQTMQIAERLGLYEKKILNMEAAVR